jgi:elongation factor Ts
VAYEKELYQAEIADSGKPQEVMEKIIEGKFDKFCKETCLSEQAFIKDETKTIDGLLKEMIVTIGENIAIKCFSRFEIV